MHACMAADKLVCYNGFIQTNILLSDLCQRKSIAILLYFLFLRHSNIFQSIMWLVFIGRASCRWIFAHPQFSKMERRWMPDRNILKIAAWVICNWFSVSLAILFKCIQTELWECWPKEAFPQRIGSNNVAALYLQSFGSQLSLPDVACLHRIRLQRKKYHAFFFLHSQFWFEFFFPFWRNFIHWIGERRLSERFYITSVAEDLLLSDHKCGRCVQIVLIKSHQCFVVESRDFHSICGYTSIAAFLCQPKASTVPL